MLGFNEILTITAAGIALLVIAYLMLDIFERLRIKRLAGRRLVTMDTASVDRLVEEIMKIRPVNKLISAVSYKLSYFNTHGSRVNYRNAFLLSVFTCFMSIILYILLIINFGSVWYLSFLYLIVIILLIYILSGLYSDFKENAISAQLPEALNDLKVAYDSKKRIKQAILVSYEDMPREIKRDFARLAESDNLEESMVFLKNRVKNQWFKIILSIMLLAVQKGDKEGALAGQLQNLNAIISQEILIKESNRMLFQLYKIFVIASPFLAIYLKNINMEISESIAGYYSSIEGMNAFAIFLITSIAGYFGLNVIEKL